MEKSKVFQMDANGLHISRLFTNETVDIEDYNKVPSGNDQNLKAEEMNNNQPEVESTNALPQTETAFQAQDFKSDRAEDWDDAFVASMEIENNPAKAKEKANLVIVHPSSKSGDALLRSQREIQELIGVAQSNTTISNPFHEAMATAANFEYLINNDHKDQLIMLVEEKRNENLESDKPNQSLNEYFDIVHYLLNGGVIEIEIGTSNND